ncbi:alpha/beta hydrolase [Arthrobacter sp. zg-Y1171]|uniref:alpha/beta hydrolase n=1 Tax=Arthrobacter sp. zg-Y1171 TaxID=2964610 RepID=UPI002103D74A|nr:alpha/beta hydrolase [Arthrobacter sp. zg-Y1171]MCQ1994158.1 alpha/beta hydrolase [Arthrobacter sp. zg-Y1171]UWX81740.1 alpha/beta hydrolase [Arthrobacter sp. zg-Y1171]
MSNPRPRRRWEPDILGEGFDQLTLDLPGGKVATLVRYTPSDTPSDPPSDPPASGPTADVLYVHGWSDYFFQTELARYWAGQGARFFAVDLHNYGRSLRPGEEPGYVQDLRDYDADVGAALEAMGQDAADARPLILLGHSTGGLTLALWAQRHPGRAAALILNSPWLEFQATELARRVISPLVSLEAQHHPRRPLPPVDPGIYTRTVSAAFGGEWQYDTEWRPVRGFPVTVAFLHAVFSAQATVAAGLQLQLPVLVLLSDNSYLHPRWSEDAARSDVVLDVNVVAHRSLSLGSTVNVDRIPNAMHDVFLSAPAVRAQAYNAITRWGSGYLRALPHFGKARPPEG